MLGRDPGILPEQSSEEQDKGGWGMPAPRGALYSLRWAFSVCSPLLWVSRPFPPVSLRKKHLPATLSLGPTSLIPSSQTETLPKFRTTHHLTSSLLTPWGKSQMWADTALLIPFLEHSGDSAERQPDKGVCHSLVGYCSGPQGLCTESWERHWEAATGGGWGPHGRSPVLVVALGGPGKALNSLVLRFSHLPIKWLLLYTTELFFNIYEQMVGTCSLRFLSLF